MTIETSNAVEEHTLVPVTYYPGTVNLPPLSPSEIEQLQQVYIRTQKDDICFPYSCGLVPGRVAKIPGFETVHGEFEVDFPINGSLRNGHSFNKTPNGRIVDLVASQFNPHLNGEALPKGIIIVEPGSPLYSRYILSGK